RSAPASARHSLHCQVKPDRPAPPEPDRSSSHRAPSRTPPPPRSAPPDACGNRPSKRHATRSTPARAPTELASAEVAGPRPASKPVPQSTTPSQSSRLALLRLRLDRVQSVRHRSGLAQAGLAQSGRLHHHLDIVPFMPYALIVVDERNCNGIERAEQRNGNRIKCVNSSQVGNPPGRAQIPPRVRRNHRPSIQRLKSDHQEPGQ